MAKNIECKCEPNRFTCGYCLRNAKPYFYTLSDGSAIYLIPVQSPNQYVRDLEAK